jgi:hypothetical protein
LLPTTAKSFDFHDGPPLRLRLLGIRYKKAGSQQTFVPSQQHVDAILSWLRRAYPVARVEATYAVIDSNKTWPFEATDVNLQLINIRNNDIAAGADARTHYYGLVDDNNFTQFMRGRASGIPTQPDPSVVASGPTGTNTWGWDFDGCYGDWYTAHELGHTFGRFHPGFCNGNSSDDPAFPYPNGQLSGIAPAYVGFDVGDASIGAAEAALPGKDWHDVMTYCENQWMSAYTYEGIRVRLLAEDALAPTAGALPVAPASVVPAPAEELFPTAAMTTQRDQVINVIASINLTKNTGRIQYVQPLSVKVPQTAPTDGLNAQIVLKDKAGNVLSDNSVPVSLESCADAAAEHMGVVNAVVPAHPDAAELELRFRDRQLDTYSAAPPPSAVTNIRKRATATPSALEAVPPTELTWDSAEAADPKVTYTVQIRRSPSEPWQTLSAGRPTPDINVDASQYPRHQKLQVRVTATNGFTTTDVTQSEIELK